MTTRWGLGISKEQDFKWVQVKQLLWRRRHLAPMTKGPWFNDKSFCALNSWPGSQLDHAICHIPSFDDNQNIHWYGLTKQGAIMDAFNNEPQKLHFHYRLEWESWYTFLVESRGTTMTIGKSPSVAADPHQSLWIAYQTASACAFHCHCSSSTFRQECVSFLFKRI